MIIAYFVGILYNSRKMEGHMKNINCKQEIGRIIKSIRTLATIIRNTQNEKDLQNVLNSIVEIRECLNRLESTVQKKTN